VNVTGWVWTESFRPYLRFLAAVTDYDLSDEELAAVVASLDGSSAELGEWRECVLRGTPPVQMALAFEVGFDNVQIQFNCDASLGLQAEAEMVRCSRARRHDQPATGMDRAKFEAALARVPDVEPEEHDRL
jgi:hypothetical protein